MSYFSAMMDVLDAALDGTGPAAIAATAFATGVVFSALTRGGPTETDHFASQKVFFLTGSASGVGKHLTTVLLKKGKIVVATDVNEVQLGHLATTIWAPYKDRLQIAKLDVRSLEQWKAVFAAVVQQYKSIDVVFNVAGYLKPGPLISQTQAETDKHMDINVKGVMYGTQVAAQHMVATGNKGHIIIMGSLASVSSVAGNGLYSASKHATRVIARVFHEELAQHGIAVTVLCPDAIQTPMLDLQVDYPEAALTFAGTQLSLEDIEKVMFETIIPKRPKEVGMPSGRYYLAWLGEIVPDAVFHSLLPRTFAQGRKLQKNYKKSSLPSSKL